MAGIVVLSTQQIAACGVIPVVILNVLTQAVPIARTLKAGGIDVMEITFRIAAAKASIERVVREVPNVIVGTGTIVNAQQLDEAAEAGAKFIVCLGSSEALIRTAATRQLPIVPGAVSPNEVMLSLELA